jgi:hypothetical protein
MYDHITIIVYCHFGVHLPRGKLLTAPLSVHESAYATVCKTVYDLTSMPQYGAKEIGVIELDDGTLSGLFSVYEPNVQKLMECVFCDKAVKDMSIDAHVRTCLAAWRAGLSRVFIRGNELHLPLQ